jgi:hypothetical protein
MTLHVAAMYFDHEKQYWGFLIGADRKSGNRNKAGSPLEEVVLTEKVFRSPNTIGLCSGAFHWPENEHERLLRSFDNTFENISEESDYSTHPGLMAAEYATLSVVKRTERRMALYGVYGRRVEEIVHVRVRKHRELERKEYKNRDETPFWQDLTVPGIPRVLCDPGRRTLSEMYAHLLWILRLGAKYHPDRISAPFDIYAIDFEGIRKIA